MYRSRTFKKMIISIILICLCFYGIGLFSSLYERKVLSDQLQDTLDSKVRFWKGRLETEMDSILLAQSSMMDDDNLLRLHVMWESLSVYQRHEMIRSISSRLLNIKIQHGIVDEVTIHFPERKVVISADSPIFDTYEEEQYADNRQIYREEDGRIRLTVYLPLNIKADENVPPYIYIRAALTPFTLKYELNKMLEQDEGTLFLMDAEGTILTSSERKQQKSVDAYPVLAEAAARIRMDGEEEWIHANAPGGGFASGCSLSDTDMWLIYCYPDMVIEEPLHFFNIFIGGLTLLTAVVFAIYSFYAAKSFAMPLNKILKAMEGEKDNNFLIKEEVQDELSLIYHRYNEMVRKTERLIHENIASAYSLHMAEFKQLQYQIQPHFLYNSLFLINRMAQLEGNDSIAEYAQHLGKYYQYVTRAGGGNVYIEQEISHIESYLAIQRTRFGDRIRAEMGKQPEEVKEVRIIPLILQPLVENAYEHGMKNVVRGGEIMIGMRWENEFFYFSVEDNGPGITQEEVERVKKQMDEGKFVMEEIHAISNTDMRLKMHYGSESGVFFENRKEGGFCVTAKIKLKEGRNV